MNQLGLLGDGTPTVRCTAMPPLQYRHSDPIGSVEAAKRYGLRHDSHDSTVLRALSITGEATYHDLQPFCGDLERIQIRRALDRLKVARHDKDGAETRPRLVYIVRSDARCTCGCGQSMQAWDLTEEGR